MDRKKKSNGNLSQDISDKPQFESDIPILDAIYNLSLEEAKLAIESDSTLRTGAKWGGVWTRDISYSIFLAFAMHEPAIAKNSLLKKVKNDRIIQDTGSGGAWPISSDRTVWAIAAWELYKFTGDKEWLRQSFDIIKNTLEDDFEVLQSSESKLYRGESSFLDWREQTYPKWMDNKDIYLSENLGTNVVHYQAHSILAKMAKALQKDVSEFDKRATAIKDGINQQLWNRERGFYNQYNYGRFKKIPSERFEALGESLAVLFGVAGEEEAFRIMSESPVTPFGVTCIYPQIPGIPPYHNNGIWPFVQSYWNLAAAKEGNEKVLTQGLSSLYRACLFFLTNYENMVAETGDYKGTEINSHQMLWSMAGNIAMVNKVFMGINLEENGIRFQPVIPSAFRGRKKLNNFKYRNATLHIEVIGYGNLIGAISMDGKPLEDGFFSADISGEHTIQIRMANNRFEKPTNFVSNHFSLPNPITSLSGNEINWKKVANANSYKVYRNGKMVLETKQNSFSISEPGFAEYVVTALDEKGWESFSSQPVWFLDDNAPLEFEMESFKEQAAYPFTNFSGSGFIEIDKGVNERLEFSLNLKESGYYLVYFTYSNGSGPWNTDNKCALRTLYLNDEKSAVFVFPQRGTNEWSDWGKTNPEEMYFKAGINSLSLELKPFNENMNGITNRAMLDKLTLIKVD
ncbi:MAG: trehalase family glycosidase [Saprospiraceae bacterium]